MDTRKTRSRTPADIWGLADPECQRKTRQDAIDDGDLIEITRMGRDAGIIYPLAVSAQAAQSMVPFPNMPQETVTENLWDTLNAFREKASTTTAEEFKFQVSLYQNGLVPTITFKATVSPGDDGEPVITIMMPDEDWETIGYSRHNACETMLTVDDVASALNFTPSRIREFIREERIAAVKCGGSWRIKRSELERIMNEGF
ncbi:MAG TPA: helix-turn-helix domain-containing protein [Candidatus Methanoculleus thermohydrogenotrophicum]|jgi:excisionase family DNA binding protein|nr:helix-turn-helix domain-containing protein [Candidatus Methanoculleus thermohydrogenotrophicum]NLM81333.1 helix-turn-helix domain-containing protein [Candidatus Methanoculleus thermohydrogenotrophicum]HOB18551.1 helix-turn-helix domain-containing protein [Candidatus Methanoculleus thermohydrogenotrophicum]HPZ38680.1 helix-turn-helix domain-containing protein [Candidatus Methanoculleus thermohydrogenotrophicum]HQC91032.1 helix-turn-helix domain-containing protein [Candidatus Methanoculleus th